MVQPAMQNGLPARAFYGAPLRQEQRRRLLRLQQPHPSMRRRWRRTHRLARTHGPRGGENPPAHAGAEPENARRNRRRPWLWRRLRIKRLLRFIVRLTVRETGQCGAAGITAYSAADPTGQNSGGIGQQDYLALISWRLPRKPVCSYTG